MWEPWPEKTLKRYTMVPVEGQVYCLTHGVVHDDTLDPYYEGQPTCLQDWGPETTRRDVHRAVLYRGKPGDIDERPGARFAQSQPTKSDITEGE